MNLHDDNKKWGVEDFKRYHAGVMPVAERHALEKAALDDPFLEDALEGYAFSAEPEANLADLRRRLIVKEDKKTSKVIWYKQQSVSNIFKIAAALILFAGLAWLLYPEGENKPVEMAANSTPAPMLDTASAAPVHILRDTSIVAQPEIVENSKQEPPLLASARTKAKSPINESKVSNKDLKEEVITDETLLAKIAEPATDDFKKRENEQAVSRKNLEASMPVAANVITGTVVDVQGKPVPYAVLTVPSLNSNLAADANGNFALANSTNLQVVQADVNAVGFEKTNTALSANNSNNKIVLQEAGNALSEVVVVGYGTTKKSAAKVAAAPEKMKAAPANDYRVILKNGKPLESWESFNETVTNQIKTNKFVDTTGVVVLSFDIDNNGAAQNISVVKKLCATCDEEAKRILQNAPAMKKVRQGKKVEAVIRF